MMARLRGSFVFLCALMVSTSAQQPQPQPQRRRRESRGVTVKVDEKELRLLNLELRELRERLEVLEEQLRVQPPVPDEEQSLLEVFSAAASDFILTRLLPRTSPDCRWHYAKAVCVPKCRCKLRYKPGDLTLSRACRLVDDVEDTCDADLELERGALEKLGDAIDKGARVAWKETNLFLHQAAPPTDRDCNWDWAAFQCEPTDRCELHFKFGDYHLGRACRQKRTEYIDYVRPAAVTAQANADNYSHRRRPASSRDATPTPPMTTTRATNDLERHAPYDYEGYEDDEDDEDDGDENEDDGDEDDGDYDLKRETPSDDDAGGPPRFEKTRAYDHEAPRDSDLNEEEEEEEEEEESDDDEATTTTTPPTATTTLETTPPTATTTLETTPPPSPPLERHFEDAADDEAYSPFDEYDDSPYDYEDDDYYDLFGLKDKEDDDDYNK